MEALPANFWELPTVAVVCLLVIGALGYYIIRQNNQTGLERKEQNESIKTERQEYILFIEGLVGDAKVEQGKRLTAWETQSKAWREMCREQNGSMREVIERSTDAMEAMTKAVTQLDRNEQLRHDAGRSQLLRIESKLDEP